MKVIPFWRFLLIFASRKLIPDIKARASLVSEFVMAVDCCIGVIVFELSDKCLQGSFLFGRPRVLGLAEAVEAADVADADGVGVVPLAVGAFFADGPSGMDAAVQADDVVVAYAAEPALTVPTVDVGGGEGLAFLGGAAMDDDFGDSPHSVCLKKNR